MFVRQLTVILLACLSCLSLRAETVALLNYEPWVISSQNPIGSGILIDMSDRLFAGDSVLRQLVPARRLLVEANAGAFDWLFHACHMSLPQHEPLGRFLNFDMGLLVLASSSVTNIADLRGQSVAVWSSRLGATKELEQDELISKVEINEISNGIRMVNEERVAALAVGSLVVDWQLSRSGLDPKRFRYVRTQAVEGCLFAHRSIPPARRDVVRKRLDSLMTAGYIEVLIKRYSSAAVPR